MSISEILIKIVGVVLVLAGLALILSAIGIAIFPVAIVNPLVSGLVGIVLIGFGIYIVRGGTPRV